MVFAGVLFCLPDRWETWWNASHSSLPPVCLCKSSVQKGKGYGAHLCLVPYGAKTSLNPEDGKHGHALKFSHNLWELYIFQGSTLQVSWHNVYGTYWKTQYDSQEVVELFSGRAHGRLGFLPMSSNVSLEQQGLILLHKGEKDGSEHNSKAGRGRSLGMGQGGEPLLKLLAAELQGSPGLLKHLAEKAGLKCRQLSSQDE